MRLHMGSMALNSSRILLVGRDVTVRVSTQVPVALGLGIYAFNSQMSDSLTLTEEACIFGGFLSFKAAHVMYLYSQLRPSFGAKKERKRPTFAEVPDIEFDMYGRVKAPPKVIEDADRALAEQEARDAAKQR